MAVGPSQWFLRLEPNLGQVMGKGGSACGGLAVVCAGTVAPGRVEGVTETALGLRGPTAE